MFLLVSVILSTGGSASVHAGMLPSPTAKETPPAKETPQEGGTPSQEGGTPCQGDLPCQGGTPPLRSRLQHMVNEQPVRILLECILVDFDNH